MGNDDNGIEIGGKAHHLVIGGPASNAVPDPVNVISANGNNGVAIIGTANNVTVSNALIGADPFGFSSVGNVNAGVLIGPGPSFNTIGYVDLEVETFISGNAWNCAALGTIAFWARASASIGSAIHWATVRTAC